MSDYEVLKECKQAYEILNDLKDNCEYTFLGIDENMSGLENVYNNAYELITSNKDTYNQITTNVKCPHCNKELLISDLINYAYVCESCDENFYYTECELEHTWWE
jgi:hypothetical protein